MNCKKSLQKVGLSYIKSVLSRLAGGCLDAGWGGMARGCPVGLGGGGTLDYMPFRGVLVVDVTTLKAAVWTTP
jgi:hypothetical protein